MEKVRRRRGPGSGSAVRCAAATPTLLLQVLWRFRAAASVSSSVSSPVSPTRFVQRPVHRPPEVVPKSARKSPNGAPINRLTKIYILQAWDFSLFSPFDFNAASTYRSRHGLPCNQIHWPGGKRQIDPSPRSDPRSGTGLSPQPDWQRPSSAATTSDRQRGSLRCPS